jgi:hypothetical protein
LSIICLSVSRVRVFNEFFYRNSPSSEWDRCLAFGRSLFQSSA